MGNSPLVGRYIGKARTKSKARPAEKVFEIKSLLFFLGHIVQNKKETVLRIWSQQKKYANMKDDSKTEVCRLE